jgi:hypothetical protein
MTALALSAPAPFALDRMRADSPVLTALGLALALSLLPTLAAMQIDDRLFQGHSIWLKPVKFQIALVIYTLTLAVYARWLPESTRAARWFRIYMVVVAVTIVGEMLWIGGAAALGTASHFNAGSPLWSALYSVMGAFAVTLTSASLVMGLAIWRNPATGLPPALHLAVALGLVLTFVLTVPVAFTMASGTGHAVGTPLPGDAGLPILGWLRSAGDLRVPHFFATHALHAIPLAGLLAVWLLPGPWARRAVILSAVAFSALVVGTTLQALAGRAFL